MKPGLVAAGLCIVVCAGLIGWSVLNQEEPPPPPPPAVPLITPEAEAKNIILIKSYTLIKTGLRTVTECSYLSSDEREEFALNTLRYGAVLRKATSDAYVDKLDEDATTHEQLCGDISMASANRAFKLSAEIGSMMSENLPKNLSRWKNITVMAARENNCNRLDAGMRNEFSELVGSAREVFRNGAVLQSVPDRFELARDEGIRNARPPVKDCTGAKEKSITEALEDMRKFASELRIRTVGSVAAKP